jgi:hypothetical protein
MTEYFRVTATSLNLRSEPKVTPANRIATLPQGHRVEKVSETEDPEWCKVSAEWDGRRVTGFAATKHLAPEVLPEGGVPAVPLVHLKENQTHVTRANQENPAYPLGEPGRPMRQAGDAASQVRQLIAIIHYLDVESSPRYTRGNGATYCNIYAHDYCYLAGVYLPRVWWTTTAIERLARGDAVPVQYGSTVAEVNANALFTWLLEFGERFEWRRVDSETELQDAANRGQVCLISAHHAAPKKSGHIAAVAPEHGAHAARRSSEDVTVPLQSQAGRQNFRFGTHLGRWYANRTTFRDFGFWVHP